MRIVIAGDVCKDRYLFSNKKKFNPESDMPCYDVSFSEERNGMAANVENNLINMGNTTHLITDLKTNIIKTRLYYKDEYISRFDEDRIETDTDRLNLVVELNAFLRRYDSVIVSDYGKGFWKEDTLSCVDRSEKSVFIDPCGGRPLEDYPYATAIVPNLKEAQDLTGETETLKMCEKLSEKAEYVVLKAGERGAFLYTKGWDKLRHFPAEQVKVIDVCGCGDTFISALATLYTNGCTISQAIIGANKAAALTVQKVGVSSPTKDEWNNIIMVLK